MRIISGKYKSIYVPIIKILKPDQQQALQEKLFLIFWRIEFFFSELNVLDLFLEQVVLLMNLYQEVLQVLYALTNKLTLWNLLI